MSYLNVNVSKFNSVKDPENPISVNLLEWLGSKYDKSLIQELRTLPSEEYKEHKKKLTGITPSGTFKKRCESELIEHSGLIQFDIDAKDNPGNIEEIKQKIQYIPYVAYLSFSTSGKGLWGMIPIQYPDKHRAQFEAIYKAFLNAGITIDRAPSNVASFRFRSYDSEPYYNHNAELFPYLVNSSANRSQLEKSNGNGTKIERLIDKIQHSKVDITEGYDNWLKIGFALAEQFGESGRKYFHQVSQFHEEYDTREADQQFTNCNKANGRGITIASFYHICREYGITLDSYHVDIKDRTLEVESESSQTAPCGMNPYTNEIFDERGYPADWDNI